jgi:uncharacterized damage-inducible protein DinB
MSGHKIDLFVRTWEYEAAQTLRLLKSLPSDRYDFRPDPQGRSLGEMAWHLAEAEAFMSTGAEVGRLDPSVRPPGLERPRTIEALAPGYERIHREAVARVLKLNDEDLDRSIPFLGDQQITIGQLLRIALLHHLIHHRGQLALICRLAGGVPYGLYGPTREDTEAMRAKAT